MKELLTPDHNLWRGFEIRLNDKISFCNHLDLEYTTKILISLYNIDVKNTLEFFMELGGFCDCEVLINVLPEWKELHWTKRKKIKEQFQL